MALELTVMSLDFEAEESTRTKQYNKLELRIGRGSENDVILSGSEVSTAHAMISLDASSNDPIIYVTDLGSTNGTFIDNKRLTANEPVALSANQRILIGEYLIKPAAIAKLATQAARHSSSNDDPAVGEESHRPDIKVIKGGKIISRSQTEVGSTPEVEQTRVLDELSDLFQPADMNDASESEVIEEIILNEAEETIETEEQIFTATESRPVPAKRSSFAAKNTAVGTTLQVQGIVGAESSSLNLVASKLVALAGTVLHKGVPLADVTVAVGEHGTVITDRNGSFEIPGIIEGSPFEIELHREDFIFDGDAFAGSVEEDGELIFHATELFSVSGQIIHRGIPLEGVTVEAGELGTTTTDADGRYEFTGVPEGTEFTLTAHKDGYVFASA